MTYWLVQTYLDNASGNIPDSVAISCVDRQLTYKELYVRSNQLANCLKAAGVGRQDRVVFCLQRSLNCIVSIFGILKSDAIYVPIDSKSPMSRWKQIIDDCEPSVIICDNTTIGKMATIPISAATSLIQISRQNGDKLKIDPKKNIITREILDIQAQGCPIYDNIDTDIAYILYTSGSTGQPKGSMISHLNIINYIDWAIDCFSISSSDRILGTAPFHFDMSTFDIFCAIKCGAKLSIATDMDLLFPNNLINLIESENVTIWKAISSLIMYLAKTDALVPGRMATLQKVLFGGEVLAIKYLIKWMQAYPHKKFYNVYGPTEATGISMYYHVNEIPQNKDTSIPIGRPCANTDILLLNQNKQLAKVNEVGELYIRGSCLSRGYWRDPVKTESEFIPNPLTQVQGDRIYRTRDLARLREDGVYEYHGRADNQIKHLGYRIELQEIESALLAIESVNDTAVTLINTDLSDIPELAAFIEFRNKPDSSDILTKLKTILPHYMIPSVIYPVENIPRTSRGKIDRAGLKKYFTHPAATHV